MAAGASQRQLTKILHVTADAVRKAILTKRIKHLPNGLIDPVAAREAWSASTDPMRTKVRNSAKVLSRGTHPAAEVRTQADAREAASLIAWVLAEEGMWDDGKGIDFGKTRTAELVLKARQRDLNQAEQSGQLVDRAVAEKLFFDTARDFQDAWPAWIGIEFADELKIDTHTLMLNGRTNPADEVWRAQSGLDISEPALFKATVN
jgi:hypothetical protein